MKKKIFWGLAFFIFILASFLRLKNVLNSPPSPYWEEVALGYDAFSIAETGKDHHGNPWPVVAFESFGDWKPSFYFYAIIPFIKLFGLNILAVRLPSIISGVLICLGIAFLTSFIFKENFSKKNEKFIFLFSFFISAISPWAITFSRGAWESNLATMLILWGINFFFLFMKKNEKNNKRGVLFLLFSVLFLILATYTYHSARFIAPLTGFTLVVIYLFLYKKKSNLKLLFPAFLMSLLLMIPLLLSFKSNVGQQRIAETSIFSDLSIIQRSNDLKLASGNSFLSKIIYHRYLLFAKEIFLNFMDHFSFNYLFVSGDINPRHSVQSFGLFYLFEIIFLISGIIFFIKNWNSYFAFLIFYLLIAIFPAAITKTTPHALRSLAAMPVFIILISFGLWQIFNLFKKKAKYVFISLLGIFYLFNMSQFWRNLNDSYPFKYSKHWQYGYEELMTYVGQEKDNYDQIFISREEGRPAMYYWFYNEVDPSLVQAANDSVKKDQGEFLEFENIKFIDSLDEIDFKEALIATSEESFEELSEENKLMVLKEIKDLSGDIVWKVYVKAE